MMASMRSARVGQVGQVQPRKFKIGVICMHDHERSKYRLYT